MLLYFQHILKDEEGVTPGLVGMPNVRD